MHPPISVILFTVLSGAGYGLFIVLGLFILFAQTLPLPPAQIEMVASGAIGLITIGLCASAFHLENPKNGWRAIRCFKTSWLSREIVFTLLFYPAALSAVFFFWQDISYLSVVMWVIAMLLAALVLYSTGMIYACLKTISQWHTLLTPLAYLFLGLASGAVIFSVICQHQAVDLKSVRWLSSFLLVIALLIKVKYYLRAAKPSGLTRQHALGLKHQNLRVLDKGTSSRTFLEKEFSNQQAPVLIYTLRGLVLIILVINWIAWLYGPNQVWIGNLLLVFMFVGVLLERWLFFSDSSQVVNLYLA